MDTGGGLLATLPFEVVCACILPRLGARATASLSMSCRAMRALVAADGHYDPATHVYDGDVVAVRLEQLDMLRGVRVLHGSMIVLSDVGTALSALEIVTGNMKCFDIATTVGLESLTTVGKSLDFSYCPALTSIVGLRSLATVGGTLDFSHCTSLATTAGLHSLTTVGGCLSFMLCAALTTTAGMTSLTTVGGRPFTAG